jgi:hypothetical protein
LARPWSARELYIISQRRLDYSELLLQFLFALKQVGSGLFELLYLVHFVPCVVRLCFPVSPER